MNEENDRTINLYKELGISDERAHEINMEIHAITQDLLKELFDYRDGNLYWKVARQGIRNDDLAGGVGGNGYRSITINYKAYYAHRLIFLFHHGYLPEFLDHIDGNKLNNDISNLREATIRQNGMNAKKYKSMNGKPTSSIYKGVTWSKSDKKWQAYIQISGKLKYLGSFKSETDAAKAYNDVAIEFFGEFANINEIEGGNDE